ncbi:MAG: hypothetical protein ACRCXM_08870 [Beijerinckiaceae bacterium]
MTATFILLTLATITGVLACMAVFVGLVALAHFFSMNARPDDDPPESWRKK